VADHEPSSSGLGTMKTRLLALDGTAPAALVVVGRPTSSSNEVFARLSLPTRRMDQVQPPSQIPELAESGALVASFIAVVVAERRPFIIYRRMLSPRVSIRGLRRP
jgi:hypothetical protein